VKREVTPAAQRDIDRALAISEAQFGREARMRYQRLISRALRDITVVSDPLGSRPVAELGPTVRAYHLRNSKLRVDGETVREPRHLLVYSYPQPNLIRVLRLLHDAMNIEQSVK